MQDVETDLIIDLSPVLHKKKTSTAKNLKHGRLPNKAKNSFENCYKMKGVFWDGRCLADLAKHRFLADLVK